MTPNTQGLIVTTGNGTPTVSETHAYTGALSLAR